LGAAKLGYCPEGSVDRLTGFFIGDPLFADTTRKRQTSLN
jgi:hypothetical protein